MLLIGSTVVILALAALCYAFAGLVNILTFLEEDRAEKYYRHLNAVQAAERNQE